MTRMKNTTVEDLAEKCRNQIPWRLCVSCKDWNIVAQTFFQEGCIIHPAPKSHSSDLFVSQTLASVVAFAIKNFSTTKFTFQTLKDEIEKAALMIKSFSSITLMVLCSNIETSSINKSFSNSSLLLEAGNYDCQDGLITKVSKEKSTMTIPQKMEVIILDQESFNTFFTQQDIKLLKQLSEKTEIPDFKQFQNWFTSIHTIVTR